MMRGRYPARDRSCCTVFDFHGRWAEPEELMPLTYHVGIHDEGFAYRVGDVWSETFPDQKVRLPLPNLPQPGSTRAVKMPKSATSCPTDAGRRSMSAAGKARSRR